MFDDVYERKKVFVTGHTGFKGSWLCTWLLKLGAEVCGFSMNIPTNPSNFEILGLKDKMQHIEGNICNRNQLLLSLREFQPDIVFHLAAQSLVRRSYNDPVTTFETNALGTLNVLECMRQCPSVQAGVIITSDKCYRNLDWTWGYRENDILGGKDPYSASKGCAELIIYSYINSFFQEGARVASARAGNVIGGGDWAEDRVVPDAVRAWSQEKSVVIRRPNATRPWQHVLEPLSAYLWIGAKLLKKDTAAAGQAFNFGPDASVNKSVEQLISSMAKHWLGADWKVGRADATNQKESTLLKLCCDKALNLLNWKAILSFEETAAMTMEWYRTYYGHGKDHMLSLTDSQIEEYSSKACAKGLPWALS
ncbi:CDP-glucose 4,6-dehydratase [Patescibacteria group bacterium]|nr:CDP-glucose 4,6-dehydratase [Desulfobacteraceae bacterium]MBU4027186.1 CDP-glucose 4,6-dehydratase [Patescibacteria group bacterium]MBU4069302.1 CDP-glucose 4,6-dehydratase [Pseudomonadota bacterium]